MPSSPRIFLSYSRDDDEYAASQRARQLCQQDKQENIWCRFSAFI